MIPTIEQVREHAESSGCGLWLLRWHGYPPELRVLRASGKHVEYWSVSIGAWIPAFVHSHPESAIACDQAGNPLPLVEERDQLREALEGALKGAGELGARLDAAESDLASMEIRLSGAEERARILLAAKDEWRARAEKAEDSLDQARAELRGWEKHIEETSP